MITCETIHSDFTFIEEYGYAFKTDVGGDWAAPSVLYSKESNDIEVGYDRLNDKMFVYLHTDGTLRNGIDLLAGIKLIKNYKYQYGIVKETLLDFLKNKHSKD